MKQYKALRLRLPQRFGDIVGVEKDEVADVGELLGDEDRDERRP